MSGEAKADTFWPEARAVVPTMSSADLVREVERLIAAASVAPPATAAVVDSTPSPLVPSGSMVDPSIVSSLGELVDSSPTIIIGVVTAPGEIVNLARDVNDVSRPDSRLFHLGQVYKVSVEEYLKGSGPSTVRIVQMEGRSAAGDGAATPPTTDAEVAAMKAQFGAIPLVTGERYMFFTKPLRGFDPERGYMVTSFGHPWWFTVPVGGVAEAGSQYPEAVAAFPPEDTAVFTERVTALVAKSQ